MLLLQIYIVSYLLGFMSIYVYFGINNEEKIEIYGIQSFIQSYAKISLIKELTESEHK